MLRSYQSSNPGPRQMFTFCNKANFYGKELSTTCPTPKMEDYPLSAVCDCLFNIFTATLHIGGPSSIHNLRTCHPVVTRDPLTTERVWHTNKYCVSVTMTMRKTMNKVHIGGTLSGGFDSICGLRYGDSVSTYYSI